MPKLRIRDANIYYEVTGEGEPLLFIHGLVSTSAMWELQVPVFSTRYKVIAFDIRGFGQSDKPHGPYSIGMFAADTAELMKSLGLNSAHIVGLSLGGMVAFQLAIDAPEMCKSLVIVNSWAETRTFKTRSRLLMQTAIGQLMGLRRTGHYMSRRMFPKVEQEPLRQMWVERLAANDKRAVRSALRAATGWSVMDKLNMIACPTLVIAADEDLSPLSLKKKYLRRIPNAELVVISDSRHCTPMDQPEEFNAALMGFLSSQS